MKSKIPWLKGEERLVLPAFTLVALVLLIISQFHLGSSGDMGIKLDLFLITALTVLAILIILLPVARPNSNNS